MKTILELIRKHRSKAAIIGVGAIVVAAGGSYLAVRMYTGSSTLTTSDGSSVPQTTDDRLAAVSVSDLGIDVSASPIADIDIADFGISGAFASPTFAPAVDSTVGFSSSVTLSAPTVKVDAPSGAPRIAQPAPEPTPEPTPESEPPAPETPPQGQVNAANCAAFAGIPSATYCAAVGDPNGRTLCEQCKAAGL